MSRIVYESRNAMALLSVQRQLQEIAEAIARIDEDGCNWCPWLPDGIPDHRAHLLVEQTRLRAEFKSLRETNVY